MTKPAFQLCGIKKLHTFQLIIPIAASAPVSISDKAQEIHSWLMSEHEQHGKPIMVRDIVNRFGTDRKSYSPLKIWKEIPGHALEELLDNSLIYTAPAQGAE